MPGLLYADDLVLYGDSEEDLRVMVGCFAEVCRRRDLKVNAGKSKVMVLGWEESVKSLHRFWVRAPHLVSSLIFLFLCSVFNL